MTPPKPLKTDYSQHTTELNRLSVLDGWRALSIALVLAGHLLPIGRQPWQLNGAVAATGMVLFFTLSGFLITRFLIKDGNVQSFLIRRILRILPLAWLGILLAAAVGGATVDQLIGNAFFFANLPPFHLLPAANHFWSLSVEVQFYFAMALLVAIGGQRVLFLLPLMALGVTGLRITAGEHLNITTWYRVDEILAGATLALVYEGKLGAQTRKLMSFPQPLFLLPLVFLSAHPASGPLNYLRPYLCTLMVGASLYHSPAWLQEVSRSRLVTYVAQVSYALYVFHGIFMASWLGSGDTIVKYAKRPILLAATFGFAHLSTFYYENRWISLARRLTQRDITSKGRPATAGSAIPSPIRSLMTFDLNKLPSQPPSARA